LNPAGLSMRGMARRIQIVIRKAADATKVGDTQIIT
jgi:hypothetical protein